MLKTFTAISSCLPGYVGEVRKAGNFTLCVTRSNFSVVAPAGARLMLHEVFAMLPLCRTSRLGRRVAFARHRVEEIACCLGHHHVAMS